MVKSIRTETIPVFKEALCALSVQSEVQSWQTVDGPSRLVLWKNKTFISSVVQCATTCSFIFNLRFLTVHVNMLEVAFLM